MPHLALVILAQIIHRYTYKVLVSSYERNLELLPVVIIDSLFPGLPSDTNVVTPNTEYSWDFTTKTRSTNDDGTSLDLEWEDEEGEGFISSVANH